MSLFKDQPTAPALQASHYFATGLKGAWLFNKSSGFVVTDYSGFGNDLSGTGTTLVWGTEGANGRYATVNAFLFRPPTVAQGEPKFNFPIDTAWAQTFYIRRTGKQGTSFDRLQGRQFNNKVDIGIKSSDNSFDMSYFDGVAWQSVGTSAVSGSAELWMFTQNTGGSLSIYKDGVLVKGTLLHAANTDQITFFAPPQQGSPLDQYFIGDVAALYIHNVFISAAAAASVAAKPFEVLTPAPRGGGGDFLNFRWF